MQRCVCNSNDVKFTGKVCGVDEPIQCVSTRPPLAHIRPNWLRSIHGLAVDYLEDFLVASRPRLWVFTRRNSSFLSSQKPTFATSNSVRALPRGYQCCTRRTTYAEVVLPIKMLITFYFLCQKGNVHERTHRERGHPQKRLSETRSLRKSSDSCYRATEKIPYRKERLESEYVALLALLVAVYIKNRT